MRTDIGELESAHTSNSETRRKDRSAPTITTKLIIYLLQQSLSPFKLGIMHPFRGKCTHIRMYLCKSQ